MKELWSLISLFVVWRLALFVPLLVGNFFILHRPGYEYTTIWKFITPYLPVSHILLYPWANFDGVHYLRIAGDGYTNNGGFFPLYPLLIRVISSIWGSGETFGSAQFFTGLVLSNIFFLLALIVFYFLIRFDYSEKIARKSIIFLLVFPTSFFFVSVYTESLFLLLSSLVFFHARRKEWLQAGILGGLLSATRLVGIAMLPVLFFEFFIQEKVWFSIKEKGKRFQLCIKSLPIVLTLVGLLSYIWFNLWKWGDPFFFVKAHGMIGTSREVSSVVFFPQTLYRYAAILTTVSYMQYEFWIALFEVCTFFFVAVLLYVAWKKKIRSSYIMFASLCFFIPVSSGTFTGLPRYAVVLFPVFIALAMIKNRNLQYAYAIISSLLLFILLLLFSKGYFVA